MTQWISIFLRQPRRVQEGVTFRASQASFMPRLAYSFDLEVIKI